MTGVMRKTLALAALVAWLAMAAAPAWADGYRRAWRGYAVGAISRNVITPYYYGYYGSHYSYVAPDPIPGPTLCALCLSPAALLVSDAGLFGLLTRGSCSIPTEFMRAVWPTGGDHGCFGGTFLALGR